MHVSARTREREREEAEDGIRVIKRSKSLRNIQYKYDRSGRGIQIERTTVM